MLALLIWGLAYLTNTRFQDWINPEKWKSVLVFLLKKLLKYLDGSEVYLEPWEVEQYHFRLLMCETCVENKKCTNCGCDTLAKMNNRKETCSKGRWPKFKTKEDWESFKTTQGIIFALTLKGIKPKDLDI